MEKGKNDCTEEVRMTRYALSSLIAGLALPPLLCAAGSLTFFILCSTVFSSLDSLAYAICGSIGVMLLLAPLAGWRLVAGRTLPPTLAERYVPLLLLPPLIYLMALSVVWPMLERPNLSVVLFYVVNGACLPWCLFALGVFGGARKSAPVRQVGSGLLRMAGYTGLAAIVIGANLYGIVDNTLYRSEGDAGKEIYLPSYLPSVSNNDLVGPASPPSLRIEANYPRLNGDISLLPLYGAVARAVYGIPHDIPPANNDADTGETAQSPQDPYGLNVVNYNWSLKQPMSLLVRNGCDIAFGDLAAAQEFAALAVREGREAPELTPIAREALVFFVHKDNPVHGLNLAQLRDIYAGRIRSWEDVGGADTRIFAFQTEDERTQQALANMVMDGRTTMRPLLDPNASVADYSNRPDALGYAFFWRANSLFPDGEIRLLAIDGIAPTPENIRSCRYPLTFPLVMATRRSPRKEVRELMDWICGPEGQALIDRAGFVSLKGRASR